MGEQMSTSNLKQSTLTPAQQYEEQGQAEISQHTRTGKTINLAESKVRYVSLISRGDLPEIKLTVNVGVSERKRRSILSDDESVTSYFSSSTATT